MDTLAHGLWGGAAFGQKKTEWKWAFLLGMAPDLISFGPYFLTRLPALLDRFKNGTWGPPDPSTIPIAVYEAYNVTHSLVVWSALFLFSWRFRSRLFWPLAAWGLHILCDIPLHSNRFFPTPYLWPFPTPFVNGRPWATDTFMAVNYTLLVAAYLAIFLYRRRVQRFDTPKLK